MVEVLVLLDGYRVILGDFNDVRVRSERLNSEFDAGAASSFNAFIEDAGLFEYRMSGGMFTFISDNVEVKFSKLDRFLVCAKFLNDWPNAVVEVLKKGCSDHCPITLSCISKNFGPTPFKLFNSWLASSELNSIVRETLGGDDVLFHDICSMGALLKTLKLKIKNWRSTKNKEENKDLWECSRKAEDIERVAVSRPLTRVEKESRISLRSRIMELHRLKARDVHQKSRVNWLKFGDENTSYFHKVVKYNVARNHIHGLDFDGIWVTDPGELKDRSMKWFKHLFREPMRRRPEFSNFGLPELRPDQSDGLIMPFSAIEILDAIKSCNGGKAPGPDGFTLKFFRKFWNELKPGLIKMMDAFYHTGEIGIGCNATFLALIAKIPDPQKLNDFRPISLVGSLYKIVSKVLANRLKGVIGSIISPVQSAFVGGRNIIDSPLVLSEVVSWAKKSKFKLLLFKVDFQRAYDSINWKFLLKTLEYMNFPPRWINWIRGCLTSARGSVIINGSPSNEFSFKRGLRQGDPMSPFLFIIVMEVLNMLMNQAVSSGFFHGVQLPNNGPCITHLCYADDVIFVGEWSDDNVVSLSRFLRCLNLISGLQVNHKKCKLYGVNIGAAEIGLMANKLSCEPGSFPFTYLGIPIGANMKLSKNWVPIINKVKSKLSSWKSKTLSFAGRVTLAKSVLGSIPSYFLSLFAAPKCVVKQFERIRRDFVWGKSSTGHKIRWIKWDKMVRPKCFGGFGVGGVEDFNVAMLTKWWWRYKENPNQLWVNVVASIHKSRIEDALVPVKRSIPGYWKDICGAEDMLMKAGISLRNNLKVVVGDGSKTKFWKDLWLGNSTLKDSFPLLFQYAANREGLVAAHMSQSNGTVEWKLEWTEDCPLLNLQHQINALLSLLNGFSCSDGLDKWGWGSSEDGEFSVQAIRKEWHLKATGNQDYFIFKWNAWAPPKCNYLLWRALLGRVANKVNLLTRGVSIASSVCDRCACGEEDSDHLFCKCLWARSIWWQVLVWVRIPFPLECSSLQDLVKIVTESPGSKRWKKIVYVIVIATVWQIWTARNLKVFEGIFIPTWKTVEQVKEETFVWLANRTTLGSLKWEKWLDFDIVDIL